MRGGGNLKVLEGKLGCLGIDRCGEVIEGSPGAREA